MAELKTTLSLNDRQFTQSMRRSQNQLRQFNKISQQVSAGIKSAFAGVSLALGAGMTVMEGFNKTLEGSQTLTDGWARAQEGLNASMNHFFNSLARADFKNFFSDLQDIVSASTDAYNALDDLGSFNLFSQSDIQDLTLEMERQRTIIKDTKTSDPEKIQAQRRLIELNQQLTDIIGERKVLEQDASIKNLELMLRENKVIKSSMSEQEKAMILRQAMTLDYYKSMQAEQKALEEALKGEISVESQKLLIPSGRGFRTVTNELKTITVEGQRLQERLEVVNNYLEVSDGKIESWNKLNKALHDSNMYLEQNSQTVNRLTKDMEDLIDANTRLDLKKLDRIDSGSIEPIVIPAVIEFPESLELGNIELLKEGNELLQERLDLLENQGIALGAVSDIFGAMGSTLQSMGSDWGAWAMNSVSAILQVIAQQGALQAQLLATGVAEQSKLPFPLNLVGMATTLTGALGIIASIPKFAQGGIMSSGDHNMALINHGEMILNSRQQKNLFRLLNSGTSQVGNTGSGKVQFEISGNNLVGSLNNTGRRRKYV